ncbi:MAG: hypothetical protein KAW92_13565, partial [Candidatus Cloacimonetes bacterium]|nr:hypothetical protein [Candidatus Cloacimonadota bacterium]
LLGISLITKYIENNFEFEFINSSEFSCNTIFEGSLCIISLNEIEISQPNLHDLKSTLSDDNNIDKFALHYHNKSVDIFFQLYKNIKNIEINQTEEQTSVEENINTTWQQYLPNDPLIIYFKIDSVQNSITLITNEISGKYDTDLRFAWSFFAHYKLRYGDRARAVRREIGIEESTHTSTYIWNYRKKFAEILKNTKESYIYLREPNILLINISSSEDIDISSNKFNFDIPSKSQMNIYRKKVLIELGDGSEDDIFPEKSIFATINTNLDLGKLELAKNQLDILMNNMKEYGLDFLYGKYYYLNNSYESAITYFSNAIKNNLYVVEALQLLAMIYKKNNELEKCELTYTTLLKKIYSNESPQIDIFSEKQVNKPFWKNIFEFISNLSRNINYIYIIPVGIILIILILLFILKKFFHIKINFKKLVPFKSKKQKGKEKKKKKRREITDSAKTTKEKDKEKEKEKKKEPESSKKKKTDSTETSIAKQEDKDKDKEIEKAEEQKEDIKKAILRYKNQGSSTDEIAEKLNIGVEEVRLVLQFNKTKKLNKE